MSVNLQSGTVLQNGAEGAEVKEMQAALRALGYLKSGVDGVFGSGSEKAVRALQYDLLHNDGASMNPNYSARAPVAMTDFNQGVVTDITGVCDAKLAGVINALTAAPEIGLIPESSDPARANTKAQQAILAESHPSAPPDFVLAIARQESGCQQYLTRKDDHYLVVGLDHKNHTPADCISSRGYGIGQYTLFHQPPSKAEMAQLCQPTESAARIFSVLRDKFAHFILGGTSATDADDRIAAHGRKTLRPCQYAEDNPLYMKNCKACAQAAQKVDITAGMPFYHGSYGTYNESTFYKIKDFKGVPVAADFACDWPYAARRYNGAGILSYFYQDRVLLNLLK